jgi:cation diffusion facilitator CzcD-associated flavoprotein CzcO
MAALKEADVAFEGVERHSGVGGIWDVTNPISSAYEGMQTVTTRLTTHLTRPMPSAWPYFVPVGLARKYLEDFADAEGLTQRIGFSTRFVDAEKDSSGAWTVSLETDSGMIHRQFRAVVRATGSHNLDHAVVDENARRDAEANGIRVIHSAEYRGPSRYAGKRVLVVGAGASGTDIAAKLSSVAARTVLSVRAGPWIVPAALQKWVPALAGLGIVPDRLAADTDRIPGRPRLAIAQFVTRLAAGDLGRYGLPPPRHKLLDRIPVLDRGILDAIRTGRVHVRHRISGFGPGVVHFDGQSDERIDDIIMATGYGRGSPKRSSSGAEAAHGDIPCFYLFDVNEPGLAFMTECVGAGSAWSVFVEQGRAIAAYFAAEQSGGQNVAAFNARRGIPTPNFKGKLFAGSDVFHIDYDLYVRALRRLTAWLRRQSPMPQ